MSNVNNIYESRKKAIGKRIQVERKKLKKENGKSFTQEDLANEINHFYNDCETITQGAISQWEKGERVPPIERLLILSHIFHCDCAYLLCDYDERIHGISEIKEVTGLSEDSINALRWFNIVGCAAHSYNYHQVIDLLLKDAWDTYSSMKRQPHQPILSIMGTFFRFNRDDTPIVAESWDGKLKPYTEKRTSEDGQIVYSMLNQTPVDNRIIENAILMEIQQALISLKETIKKEE